MAHEEKYGYALEAAKADLRVATTRYQTVKAMNAIARLTHLLEVTRFAGA